MAQKRRIKSNEEMEDLGPGTIVMVCLGMAIGTVMGLIVSFLIR